MTTMKAIIAAAAVAVAVPAAAQESLSVSDPYALVSSAAAQSGAVFMTIENAGDSADRLVSASSDAADQVQLHTHEAGADGVMKMTEVESGFEVSAGGTHKLERGGDHVMLMGLAKPLADGDTVNLTLTFESGQTLEVQAPVDSSRAGDAGMEGMESGRAPSN